MKHAPYSQGRRARGRNAVATLAKIAMVLSGVGCASPANALTGQSVAGSTHAVTPALTLINTIVFSVADIGAEPGETVPIPMTLPSPRQLEAANLSEGAFILIRNVPQGITISAGMFTGKVWIVSLADAGDLYLTSMPDMIGAYTLSFFLIGPGNKLAAKDDTTLTLQLPASRGATSSALEPTKGSSLQTNTDLTEKP